MTVIFEIGDHEITGVLYFAKGLYSTHRKANSIDKLRLSICLYVCMSVRLDVCKSVSCSRFIGQLDPKIIHELVYYGDLHE